jgi:hypothetical protein
MIQKQILVCMLMLVECRNLFMEKHNNHNIRLFKTNACDLPSEVVLHLGRKQLHCSHFFCLPTRKTNFPSGSNAAFQHLLI